MAEEDYNQPVDEQQVEGEGEAEQQNAEGEEQPQYENYNYGQPQEEQAEEQNVEEQPPAEEAPPEEPQPKVYAPPNPTIKECIQLNQLMPMIDMDKNIEAISSAIYENDDLLNEFLQKVDSRMKVCTEDLKGNFIQCEQNRDGDSYRSPFSNKYFPPAEADAKYPSPPLRKLEEKLNKMFQIYAKMYYSNTAVSSVYCWELGDSLSQGYGVAVMNKHDVDSSHGVSKGNWDSSNLITVTFQDEGGKKKAKYNLITSVNIAFVLDNKTCGKICLSGTIAKSSHYTKTVKDYVDDDAHVANIGVLVEDMETGVRSTLQSIYCQKSKEIIDKARWNPTLGGPRIAQSQKLKEAWKGGMKGLPGMH